MRPDWLSISRWRGLIHELAKFGTIGVINLVINFAVFNLLILTVLADGQLKAKAAATVVATTCAYFMNRHWTYRDRPKSTLRREYSLFFFFNLVGLVIEVAVVGLAKYGFSITHLLALNVFTAVGIGLGTIFRFWAYRTHVFKLEPVTQPIVAQHVAEPAATIAQPAATATVAAADIALALMVTSRDDGDSDLNDELTEIELEGIVASAEQPARTTS